MIDVIDGSVANKVADSLPESGREFTSEWLKFRRDIKKYKTFGSQ